MIPGLIALIVMLLPALVIWAITRGTCQGAPRDEAEERAEETQAARDETEDWRDV